MPTDAFALALGAAVLHAGWNVILRGSEDVQALAAKYLAGRKPLVAIAKAQGSQTASAASK